MHVCILLRYSGTFFMCGWMTAGWRSLSCLSSCRSLGLSSKYVWDLAEKHSVTTRSHTSPHLCLCGRVTFTHLEFFWVEQLLLDLLESGFPHRLFGHWTHRVLQTKKIHHPNFYGVYKERLMRSLPEAEAGELGRKHDPRKYANADTDKEPQLEQTQNKCFTHGEYSGGDKYQS